MEAKPVLAGSLGLTAWKLVLCFSSFRLRTERKACWLRACLQEYRRKAELKAVGCPWLHMEVEVDGRWVTL